MSCLDAMKRDIFFITLKTTVTEAATLMRDAAVGFLPVCDDAQQVVGVLTDRDIVIRVLAESRSADQPVEQVMTTDVVACRPDEDLSVAQALMGQVHPPLTDLALDPKISCRRKYFRKCKT